MFGALLSVVGNNVRSDYTRQEDLAKMLAAIAEKVKASKDKEVGLLLTSYLLLTSPCSGRPS